LQFRIFLVWSRKIGIVSLIKHIYAIRWWRKDTALRAGRWFCMGSVYGACVCFLARLHLFH
jgi:hypothetical protein